MIAESHRRTGIGADGIRYVHTLGPHGTNLETAAHEWLHRRGIDGKIQLHASLEAALDAVPDDGEHALAACAVYPALHTLTFGNLHRLHMVDSFIMPTHNMVLASAGVDNPRTVSTHPAPVGLVPEAAESRLVLSNSQAAIDCAAGSSEGCVTTIVAAERYGLRVLRDYGPVPMVFTIHQVLAVDVATDAAADTAAGRPETTGALL
ncbi:MAG: bacilysin biosynthesis protein BacA [Streptomyces sp.]|uniref:bacilysin biosynthesis protein BacA n=1 Tax=Streptomyces sp. TaxID=1931 RepID=UPI003D6C19C1